MINTFNAANILKIVNEDDIKSLLKIYANIIDDNFPQSENEMKIAIIKTLAENQVRQDMTKSKFGKYQVNRIKLIEKALDKLKVSSAGEVFKRVYISPSGTAYMTDCHWLIKTTKENIEGINPKYIITDDTKGNLAVPRYDAPIPKDLDCKISLTAQEIKKFIKINGKDYTKEPFTFNVKYRFDGENIVYYVNQNYLEFMFKFYGTDTLNIFLNCKKWVPVLGISKENTWNKDDLELAIISCLNPNHFKGENK